MAMGPGVCLEYGGMTRYDPSKPRKAAGGSRNDGGNGMVMILLAIIVLLVAFIFSGKTVADLQGLL